MLVDARIQFVQLIDDTVKDAFSIGAVGEQPLRQRVGEKLGVRGRRLGLDYDYETVEVGEFVRVAEIVLTIAVIRSNQVVLAGLKFKVLPGVEDAYGGKYHRRGEHCPGPSHVEACKRTENPQSNGWNGPRHPGLMLLYRGAGALTDGMPLGCSARGRNQASAGTNARVTPAVAPPPSAPMTPRPRTRADDAG